jgi:hypothetical protein
MPYVKRNEEGKIIAVWKEHPDPDCESVPDHDLGLAQFLSTLTPEGNPGGFSIAADLQMVRVIEDVINLLIEKHVIVLTELPEAVQNKLLLQRARREHLVGSTDIISEGEQGLF